MVKHKWGGNMFKKQRHTLTGEAMTSHPPCAIRHAPMRRSGIALLLVLFAVATAVVLGAAFLGAQSTSTGIAQNVDRHAVARQIAESALMMGVHYVQEDTDWRTNKSHGVWVLNHPLLGGTFTLLGEDEADGDFANNNDDPVTLTAIGSFQGVTHIVSLILLPGDVSNSPGMLTGGGVAAHGEIELKSNAVVNSYNSSLGQYGGSNIGSEAILSTNSTSSNRLKISSSAKLYGDAYVGSGGNPDSVISAGSNTITGDRLAQSENVEMASLSQPSGMPSSSGSLTVTGNTTIGSDRTYSDFKIQNNGKVTINGHVRILVNKTWTVQNKGELIIPEGSSLHIWVKEDIVFQDDAKVNADTTAADRLHIYGLATGDKFITQNKAMVTAVIDLNSEVELKDDSHVYGSLRTRKKLMIDGKAQLHLDVALTPYVVGSSGGGSQATTFKMQWMESP